MTHSPAEILAAMLTEDSDAPFTQPTDGLTWPLYVSSLPDAGGVAANVAAVYDTTPKQDARIMATGEEIWSYGIQIRVRSSGYNVGWVKAKSVSDLLSLVHNATVVIDGHTYLIECFAQTTSVLSIGYDEQRRSSFTINGFVALTETT